MTTTAALGCRAHTGWAALVVVVAETRRPGVVLRRRVELGDPAGHVRRNAFQAARGLGPAEAAALVAAAEHIAAEQAVAALRETVRDAGDVGADVRSCAVVVGALLGPPLDSILASHALAHAAEGRLYQQALLHGAEASGLQAVPIPKRSIWEQGESTLGIGKAELQRRIAELRRVIGAPWAEDQKLAALAAWITLQRCASPCPGGGSVTACGVGLR